MENERDLCCVVGEFLRLGVIRGGDHITNEEKHHGKRTRTTVRWLVRNHLYFDTFNPPFTFFTRFTKKTDLDNSNAKNNSANAVHQFRNFDDFHFIVLFDRVAR